MERATYVAENRPELLEEIDAGRKTISGAYAEAKKSKAEEAKTLKAYAMDHLNMGMVPCVDGNHKMFGHMEAK